MTIISVIIPTYNRASYIKEALESVLNQSLPQDYELEVIVIDDGSTDNTEKILEKYASKIIYKKIKHSGKPAVARNAGLKISSGKIIAFQDSDDIWPPNKIKIQLALLDDKDTIMSFGQAEIIDKTGKKTGELVVPENEIKNGESFETLLRANSISTLTVMLKKEALDKVGNFNESDSLRAIEDYELWLRIVAAFPGRVKSTDKILAQYRRHDMNISKSSDLDSLFKIRDVFIAFWERQITNQQRTALEGNLALIEENIGRLTAIEGKAPKISVVMSVLNGQDYLKEAIESILSQTLKSFEFIIINDGSTDKTTSIINSFNDPRIRHIRQNNHGLVYSLNKAIRLSSSSIIARMDADDISYPNRLEEEYILFEQNKTLGVVSTYFELIDFKKSKPTGVVVTPLIKNIDIKRSFYFVNPLAHGAAMFRKEAFLQAGKYRSTYGPTEDYDLWRRISKNWELEIVPKVLFSYRINNPTSISQSKNKIQEKYVQKIREELIDEPFINKDVKSLIKDYKDIRNETYSENTHKVREEYINNQYTIARIFLEKGQVKKAVNIFASMFIIKPKYVYHIGKLLPKGVLSRLEKLK